MDRLNEIATRCYTEISALGLNAHGAIVNAIKAAMEQYHKEQSSPEPADAFHLNTFKLFYERYGKKVGRVVAQRRWMKLKKSEIEAILDTVSDFVAAHPEPQYRPHPATYLAQRRWEDELPNRPKPKIQGRENTWRYE